MATRDRVHGGPLVQTARAVLLARLEGVARASNVTPTLGVDTPVVGDDATPLGAHARHAHVVAGRQVAEYLVEHVAHVAFGQLAHHVHVLEAHVPADQLRLVVGHVSIAYEYVHELLVGAQSGRRLRWWWWW